MERGLCWCTALPQGHHSIASRITSSRFSGYENQSPPFRRLPCIQAHPFPWPPPAPMLRDHHKSCSLEIRRIKRRHEKYQRKKGSPSLKISVVSSSRHQPSTAPTSRKPFSTWCDSFDDSEISRDGQIDGAGRHQEEVNLLGVGRTDDLVGGAQLTNVSYYEISAE